MKIEVVYRRLPTELRQEVLRKLFEALFREHLAALFSNNITYAGPNPWQSLFLSQLSLCLDCECKTPKVLIWPLQQLELLATRNFTTHERQLELLQDHCDDIQYEARHTLGYPESRFLTRQLCEAESRAEFYNQKFVLLAEQQVRMVRCMIDVLQSLSDGSSAAGLRQKWQEAWMRTQPTLVCN